MKYFRFTACLLLAAVLAIPIVNGPILAQTFQSLGSASLAVTSASGSVALPAGNFGNNITLQNVGSNEAFIAFGASTITATTSSESIPAGAGRCFSAPSATYVAAITASSTTTLRISQGSGPCSISFRGGSGSAAPSGPAGGGLSGTYPNPSLAAINSIATSVAVGGATIGSDALAWTGTATGSGVLTIGGLTNSGNGAASVAPSLWSGTLFTGGTATTTFPQIFVQPTGTTAATTWSTSGTGLGMNLASGFAGNFLDFHVAGGASVFNVASSGAISTASTVTATSTITGSALISTGSIQAVGTGNLNWSGRGILTSPAAGSIQLGNTDAAAPVAQTFRTQSVVAGTAAASGANWTWIGSLPTGTGTSGDIIFQTGVKTGSGTTQGTATTALTIKGETQNVVANAPIVTKGYTVSTLPTGTTGARAHVTDATACTFLGALTGGAATFCPVVYNGSAWVGG